MKVSIVFTFILLASVGQVTAGPHTPESTENNKFPNTSQAVFQIAAETAPCAKGSPIGRSVHMKCLIVDGEVFYEGIDGYDHQEGVGRIVKIARTQVCDPDVFNSCPQDIGSIYSYRLLEIIE
ncbi:MAG: DUF4377 domain-containing protein [Rhizobiales bacterium]|nr:DUF4377 domain-containing protein [Hyphomicrobiales bacterium]